jgi:hypothetical protein
MRPSDGDRPLVLAFYLPQFHPVPENDAWWGQGFTEWTNVVQARPLFDGHEQPHLPGALGYYDLRLPEVREHQAALAGAHGIDAFLYYHYWFGGRQVLERPFDEVRRTGRPDLPFALCWANENWTRAWDAGQHEVLLEQSYGPEERAAHLAFLVDAFADERYLRIDGRPLFAIYRIGALPEAEGFVAELRAASVAAGVGDPYLVKFDTHGNFEDPAVTGCDVAAQFFPHGTTEMGLEDLRLPLGSSGNMVIGYDDVVGTLLDQPAPPWTRHECVTPGWDNTPRRGDGRSLIVHGSTPDAYEAWLRRVVERAPARATTGPGIVFVNAWNEWAEGAHLEPDERWGDAYLRATARAVLGHEPPRPPVPPAPEDLPPTASFESLYQDLYDRYVDLQRRLSGVELAAQRRVDRAVGPLEAQLREQHELTARLAEELSRRLGPD